MRKDLSFAYPGFVDPPLTRLLAVLVVPRLSRRHFMITSAAGGIAGAAGCTSKPEEVPATAERIDVPLRVLLCGTDAWAEAISIAWGGVAEQPLAIEVVQGFTDQTDGGRQLDTEGPIRDFGRHVADKMTSSDVGIVPCGLMPTLSAEASFTPLGTAFMDDADLAVERMLPVLRESAMRWAGNQVAIPYGSVQPALLIAGETDTDTLDVPQTWDEFIQVARAFQATAKSGDTEPLVSEPLAGGAAAKMFLWRACDAVPSAWLFNRETFEPILTDEVYVRTLERMHACARLYGDRRLTAGEVWSRIAGGRLRMAIGWPGTTGDPPRIDSLGDTLVVPLPRDLSPHAEQDASAPQPRSEDASGPQPRSEDASGPQPRSEDASGPQPRSVMADPDSPVGLISSRCRQTAAAKRFLIWLSGGEGSEMIRAAAPAMTVLRTTAVKGPGGSYEDYLITQLSSIHQRPTLRLHGYDRYLRALDQQVLACLDGKSSAAEALAATSDAWRSITAEVGAQLQAQAWRYAQGLRT